PACVPQRPRTQETDRESYEIVIGGRAARGGRGALTSRRERLRRACGAVPSEPGSRRDADSRGKRPGYRTPADDAPRRRRRLPGEAARPPGATACEAAAR